MLTAEQLQGVLPLNSPKALTLTLLSEPDLDPLCQIERSVHSHPWSRQHFASCLTGRQRCLLVKHHNTLVAYAVVCAAAGSAELLNLAVAPAWQRQGIAKALLKHLFKVLADSADTLYLEVRESNDSAISLYQSLGFAEVGTRPNYYPATQGRENATIFAYPLAESH